MKIIAVPHYLTSTEKILHRRSYTYTKAIKSRTRNCEYKN